MAKSQSFEYLKGLAEQKGFVMVAAEDLAEVLREVVQLKQDLEVSETAHAVAADGYRTALQEAGIVKQQLRELVNGADCGH